MQELVRQVRFSVNPFLPSDRQGFNCFASNPPGEGLAIFFELSVKLTGKIHPDTGFIVNVTEIDRKVRWHIVKIFGDRVRKSFQKARHIGFADIARLLASVTERLAGEFAPVCIAGLELRLNPYRKMSILCEDLKMIYFSEKFEFAATHKLWNEKFSDEENFNIFGKCANPAGHGHNYIIEVTVKSPAGNNLQTGWFEKIIEAELIQLIDHKNLNTDVQEFTRNVPTVENIAVFAWEKLKDKFGKLQLHCVSVWETDKTCCCYYGPDKNIKN